jgi:pilus assembly protein CpaB
MGRREMMWKVKRMNTARIVVLVVAIGAGGVAAYLASGPGEPPQQAAVAPTIQMETTDVLVASGDIALGQIIKESDFQWQSWPAASASGSFIKRSSNAGAPKQLSGSIARAPMIAGEPIRELKLVRADGSGFMAAILPEGMRAVSTEISPETGAGGFILPNDRVDVILSRKNGQSEGQESADAAVSQIILGNVRVLAIDQTIEEKFDKDGKKSVLGKTVTLELSPAQTETLAMARQTGTISLALRSMADASKSNNDAAKPESTTSSVNMVRFGVSTKVMAK